MSEDIKHEDHVEEPTSQETIETDVEGQGGEGEAVDWEAKYNELQVKNEELETTNKKLYARTQKSKSTKKAEPSDNSEQVDNLDIAQFFSQGNTKEDYNDVLAVMRGRNLSFEEAQKDPMYVALKEKKAQDERREKAQMGASKPGMGAQDTTFKPGMTKDDHKKEWKAKMGK